MRTTFDATYFAPKVGDVVQGTVSRLGQDHVALLVLGIFNASVPHEQPGQQPGQQPSPRPSLRPGDKAVFIVRSLMRGSGLISMVGEFLEAGSYRPYSAEEARWRATSTGIACCSHSLCSVLRRASERNRGLPRLSRSPRRRR